jgi:hypothetical protein
MLTLKVYPLDFPHFQERACVQGGYAIIYLKFTILKNYMHRARAGRAHVLARATRAKVGGMSQLWTIQALN